jgi:hypothetical protein
MSFYGKGGLAVWILAMGISCTMDDDDRCGKGFGYDNDGGGYCYLLNEETDDQETPHDGGVSDGSTGDAAPGCSGG